VSLPLLGVLAASVAWAALFGWLSVTRHLALGSHAEDLGFTDQVIANFLRGQWFRMSIYQGGATWNTELDIARITRPDSLLAFHVEPMLLLFVPLYAFVGAGGASLLLVIQAVMAGFGAVPAYRLGAQLTGSATCGLAVAASYLLAPFGQWAVLSDFHTSTLAAPLLLLAVERLVVAGSWRQSLVAGALALSAREDVGPTLALLGLILFRFVRPAAHDARQAEVWRRTGVAFVVLGLLWTAVCVVVIRNYAGGDLPFAARYADSLGNGREGVVEALTRSSTLGYAAQLALSGGWLGLLSPALLLPALPSLAINTLSSSPWMASGQAHYSGLVWPFVALAAAGGLRRLQSSRRVASVVLVVTAVVAYLATGAGPLSGNFAPAQLTSRADRARQLAAELPADASVSGSSSLVPHLTRRAQILVFPAVANADYVFLDLLGSPAPTSAGDVYLRVQAMLADGWRVALADDGLLLLEHGSASDLDPRVTFHAPAAGGDAIGSYLDGRVQLLTAQLVPSPDAALEPDGPRWILRTTWRATEPLPRGARLEFWIDLRDGSRQHVWDVAHLWWNPPERWTPGEAVVVDVRDVPVRSFKSWQATLSTSDGN